jgi:septum formation protein
MELILASTSPSRKAVLVLSGIPFKVVPSNSEEVIDRSQPPDKIVQSLARLKANAVAKNYPEDVIVGCDTIVWIEGRVLGKPADIDVAFEMLRQLYGRTH